MEVVNLNLEVEQFMAGLQKPTFSKVLRQVGLLRQFGNALGLPHSRVIASNLFELRTRGQQEVRIFYTFNSNKAVLLCGFIKKSQKTPASEIERAQKLQKSLP